STIETQQHLAGKASVQINCRLGAEDAIACPAPQAFLINVVFVWHRHPPGQTLEVLAAVESSSSGGGHRSRFPPFRTSPAVEAHVLLDDQSGEQIDDCLNSKSPLALSAPHSVFIMHTPERYVVSAPDGIGETASAHETSPGFIPN